jgi:hypothetical protein
MRTTRVLPLALASVLALAATGCGSDFKKDEPQTAVRDFLSDTLAQQNGQKACDYLTQEAQEAVAGSLDRNCRTTLERAELVGDKDREQVDTTGDVKDLKYATKKTGQDATVTVTSKGGPTLTVQLKKDEGLGNLYKPPSPWRITGGVEPLVKGS